MERNNGKMQVIGKMDFYGIELDIYGSIEEPWFKADDVAKCIEHSNTSKMMQMVDKEEQKMIFISTLTNGYSALVVSEFGLYGLLFKSRLPKAEEFNKKVMLTLKQIRLTGGYIPVNTQDTEETIKTKAEAIAKETTKHYEDLIAMQQRQIEELESYNKEADDVIDTLKNDVRYLYDKTDYGVHSISESYKIITNTVNRQRTFVTWFKEKNATLDKSTRVEILADYINDETGSHIKNAIDLNDINTFHRFKDLCYEFLNSNKEIR